MNGLGIQPGGLQRAHRFILAVRAWEHETTATRAIPDPRGRREIAQRRRPRFVERVENGRSIAGRRTRTRAVVSPMRSASAVPLPASAVERGIVVDFDDEAARFGEAAVPSAIRGEPRGFKPHADRAPSAVANAIFANATSAPPSETSCAASTRSRRTPPEQCERVRRISLVARDRSAFAKPKQVGVHRAAEALFRPATKQSVEPARLNAKSRSARCRRCRPRRPRSATARPRARPWTGCRGSVARYERRAQVARGVGQAVSRRKSRRDARVGRIAEVQTIRHSQRPSADRRDVADGFDHREFGRALRSIRP